MAQAQLMVDYCRYNIAVDMSNCTTINRLLLPTFMEKDGLGVCSVAAILVLISNGIMDACLGPIVIDH